MEFEVFLVSIIYWVALMGVLVWLGQRLSSLKSKLASLNPKGISDEN